VTSETYGRAAVLTDYNQPFEIREYPVPEAEDGAIVVRVDVATVCGSDVHIWDGSLAAINPLPLPLILGHEVVGEVVALGRGADVDSVGAAVRVGDRMIWAPAACGHCDECSVARRPELCPNRQYPAMSSCEGPPHFGGGFAEYSYVRPNQGRIRVPDDVSSEWAAAGSCALRTVINAFERVGQIDYRHTVVIQGAGPLGLFATAFAATHSPKSIVVIGGPEERLEVAREWGADGIVAIEPGQSAADRVEAVRELTGGGGDVVLEMSGARGAVAEGIEMAARGARYGVVGTVGGAPQEIKAHLITHRALTLVGTFSGDVDSYAKALRFLRANQTRFDWNRMITRRYGLDDVTTCMERMMRFEEIKPVVIPSYGTL
jgi:L-iditol 2-dehydrogenase